MKEIKLKERLENAFETFFDNERLNENTALEFVTHETSLTTNETSFFSEHINKTLNVLRQLFLFLPTSFLLFFATTAFTARIVLIEGEGVQTVSLLGLILLLGLALATILGLGDLRKPKHLLIPLSITSIGMILGIIGSFFFDWFGFGNFLFNYVPYFFPLALIIPILAKNWADDSDDKFS